MSEKKTVDKMPAVDLYSVYKLNDVTYLPHYLNESVYVGPAYNKTGRAYSAEFLIRHGAKREAMNLWKRGTTGRIENVAT
jgi:hypothetical protein